MEDTARGKNERKTHERDVGTNLNPPAQPESWWTPSRERDDHERHDEPDHRPVRRRHCESAAGRTNGASKGRPGEYGRNEDRRPSEGHTKVTREPGR